MNTKKGHSISAAEMAQYIDHTLLKPEAAKGVYDQLCQEARQYKFKAVCVNSGYVSYVAEQLKGSGIAVCSVIGFPLGATDSQAEELLLSWRWVEQEAAFNALEAELEPLREAIERRAGELEALAEEIERLERAWELADEQLQEATKQLAQTDVAQQRQTIRFRALFGCNHISTLQPTIFFVKE